MKWFKWVGSQLKIIFIEPFLTLGSLIISLINVGKGCKKRMRRGDTFNGALFMAFEEEQQRLENIISELSEKCDRLNEELERKEEVNEEKTRICK